MKKLLLAAMLMATVASTARAQLTDNVDSGSANFWIEACKEGSTGKLVCTGYFRALYDANEMLRWAYKRPLWCSPDGVTLDQLQRIVFAEIAKNPADQHLPFMGLANNALARAFPCPEWKK